jgi:hypothetical protein
MLRAHGRADFVGEERERTNLPGRWHDWQFFWRIGRTSFVNVGVASAALVVVLDAAAMASTRIRAPEAYRTM